MVIISHFPINRDNHCKVIILDTYVSCQMWKEILMLTQIKLYFCYARFHSTVVTTCPNSYFKAWLQYGFAIISIYKPLFKQLYKNTLDRNSVWSVWVFYFFIFFSQWWYQKNATCLILALGGYHPVPKKHSENLAVIFWRILLDRIHLILPHGVLLTSKVSWKHFVI